MILEHSYMNQMLLDKLSKVIRRLNYNYVTMFLSGSQLLDFGVAEDGL